MVATRRGAAGRRHVRRVIRRNANAPSAARRVVTESAGDHPFRDETLLVVSELATNVVRHAPPDAEELSLDLWLELGSITVEVASRGGRFDEHVDNGEPGGHGLQIVDEIATNRRVFERDRWAVTRVVIGEPPRATAHR